MGIRGAFTRWGARLFTASRPLARLWGRLSGVRAHDGIPWAPLRRPLRDCRVALVTTAGVHLEGDVPFDMADPQGDPSWRAIPGDAPDSALAITHDYYDHRDADRDLGVVFPLSGLRALAAGGEIREVASTHYGFMGHVAGPHLDTLVARTAPEVAGYLAAAEVDLVLLSPA